MIDLVKRKISRWRKAKNRSKGSIRFSPDRPRVVVYKSRKYLYAQVVDDFNKKILLTVSSISRDLKDKKLGKNVESAKILGKELGKRLKEKNIASICFDRNGFKYHGKIKALAEACREEGIKF